MIRVPPPEVWRRLPPVPQGLLERAQERFYGSARRPAAMEPEDVWALVRALDRLADIGEERVIASVSPEFMRMLEQAAKMARVCANVRPTADGLVLSVRRPEPLL